MQDTSNTQNQTNRRLFIYLAIAALLLLGVCLGSYFYLVNSANHVLEVISEIEDDVAAGSWETANAEFDTAKGIWDKHKNIWQCFLVHQEIDEIESAFMKLQGYIETKAREESLSSLYELAYSISHVPDTERISLYNIL